MKWTFLLLVVTYVFSQMAVAEAVNAIFSFKIRYSAVDSSEKFQRAVDLMNKVRSYGWSVKAQSPVSEPEIVPVSKGVKDIVLDFDVDTHGEFLMDRIQDGPSSFTSDEFRSHRLDDLTHEYQDIMVLPNRSVHYNGYHHVANVFVEDLPARKSP